MTGFEKFKYALPLEYQGEFTIWFTDIYARLVKAEENVENLLNREIKEQIVCGTNIKYTDPRPNRTKKILYSPYFGAGWYTWNTDYPDCITNPEIIDMVEGGVSSKLIKYRAKELWPNGYWDGARNLEIREIEEGIPFRIEEYDGSESVKLQSEYKWFT